MSFPKNDRKIQPQFGKMFPFVECRGAAFLTAISTALKDEFGRGPAAVKAVARLTNTNERAVRNWYEAKNSPSAENLVVLIAQSDIIFATVLALSNRKNLSLAGDLAQLRKKLSKIMRAIDDEIVETEDRKI